MFKPLLEQTCALAVEPIRTFTESNRIPGPNVTCWQRCSMLSFAAGFADTSTFLGIGGLFSAHVTGSLLLLVVSLGRGWHHHDLLKLLEVPLFAATAALAGRFRTKFLPTQWLYLEANLLMLAALFGLFDRMHQNSSFEIGVMVCAVTGMTLQTYLGRLYPAEYGVTTAMTNNIMQIILNISQFRGNAEVQRHFLNDVARVIGFLVGCALGAVLTRWIGMVGFMLPAFLVILVANSSAKRKDSEEKVTPSSPSLATGFTQETPSEGTDRAATVFSRSATQPAPIPRGPRASAPSSMR
jgi:uncharacterized membrane protein YoaK (UPF0700 family)